MSDPSADHVLYIDKRLNQLSPISSECCIFRVHDGLRNVNENAYEPEVVAIGPYHHGKDKLQPMEEHKLRYLQQLLKQRNETSVERYFVAMQKFEERARKFYAEPISLDSNKFVEMMLLDSCFIVELLRKTAMSQLRDQDDPIFKLDYIQCRLKRDLMLFENQIPFFILMQLFRMTQNSACLLDGFVDMICSFFDQITPGEFSAPPPGKLGETDIKHLVGLLHYCCCYEFHSMVSQRNNVELKYVSLKSATELQDAGIKFQKVERGSILNIRFVNGTLEIPTLTIQDITEPFLRNLIAYEQYLPNTSRNYFTAYRRVFDHLVNTSKDVEILTNHGIIDNFLGDHEVVSTMLNNLGNNVSVDFLCYNEVYNKVNEHCLVKCNIWLANLRRDYFNTPWALISFLAAVVLLLLTVAQTVFSIFSVEKN